METLRFQSLGVTLASVQVKNWSKFLQKVYKSKSRRKLTTH